SQCRPNRTARAAPARNQKYQGWPRPLFRAGDGHQHDHLFRAELLAIQRTLGAARSQKSVAIVRGKIMVGFRDRFRAALAEGDAAAARAAASEAKGRRWSEDLET